MIMKWRVKIEGDAYFDPTDLADEIADDFRKGEIFAYEVVLETACEHCGSWEYAASRCGVLLDREYWAGTYSPDDIEGHYLWKLDPDANHLTELVNEMVKEVERR